SESWQGALKRRSPVIYETDNSDPAGPIRFSARRRHVKRDDARRFQWLANRTRPRPHFEGRAESSVANFSRLSTPDNSFLRQARRGQREDRDRSQRWACALSNRRTSRSSDPRCERWTVSLSRGSSA